MWATSVPILVFLGLSVVDLGPMYATDRRQTASSLNAPARGAGITSTHALFGYCREPLQILQGAKSLAHSSCG